MQKNCAVHLRLLERKNQEFRLFGASVWRGLGRVRYIQPQQSIDGNGYRCAVAWHSCSWALECSCRHRKEEVVSNAEVLIFTHRFSRTLRCQTRVVDCPPARGRMLQCTCKWTGRPKAKHLREYAMWRHAVREPLAQALEFESHADRPSRSGTLGSVGI